MSSADAGAAYGGEPGVLGEAGPTCRAASAGRPEQRSARSPQAASEAAATRRAATQQQQEQPAGADQLTEAAAGLSLELPAGSEAKARAKAPPGAAELADALPLGSRDRGHTACPPHGAKAICGRRPRMEDAYTAIPFLLEVPVPADCLSQMDILPPRIATQVKSASNSPTSSDGDGSGDEGAGSGAAKANGRLGARETHRIDSNSSASTSGAPGDASSAAAAPPPPPYMETLHFFGVFDGHGGAEAALHCAQTLHQRIAEALSAATTGPSSGSGSGGSDDAAALAAAPPVSVTHAHLHAELGAAECSTCPAVGAAVGTEEASLVTLQPSGSLTSAVSAAALASVSEVVASGGGEPLPATVRGTPRGPPGAAERAHSRGNIDRSNSSASDALVEAALDEAVQSGEPAGREAGRAGDEDAFCSVAKFESALQSAFNRTDEEFGKADNAALVGTTAVVALVGSRHLYVANCGDSRAVLCRGSVAIPLTDDHKAAREDETARVEAAGGQILFWNGVRVMGVLAVSRAIGDHCLRPFVIAEPEVTILARRLDDELLLLASDGLWDVLSNQEACTLAKRCLRRARQRGASRQSAARIAATVLTRAAVDRGSRDNVTVVVVDLSVGGSESDALARTPSAAVAEDADAGGDDDGLPPDLLRSRSQAGSLEPGHPRDGLRRPAAAAPP